MLPSACSIGRNFDEIKRCVEAMQGLPVTIRTVDIGADKPLDAMSAQELRHEDLLNPANEAFLQAWYRYHREGLDRLSNLATQTQAKQAIAGAVMALKPLHTRQPNMFLLRWFFDAKSVELQQVYSGGPQVPTQELVEALQVMDASNASKYLKMGTAR